MTLQVAPPGRFLYRGVLWGLRVLLFAQVPEDRAWGQPRQTLARDIYFCRAHVHNGLRCASPIPQLHTHPSPHPGTPIRGWYHVISPKRGHPNTMMAAQASSILRMQRRGTDGQYGVPRGGVRGCYSRTIRTWHVVGLPMSLPLCGGPALWAAIVRTSWGVTWAGPPGPWLRCSSTSHRRMDRPLGRHTLWHGTEAQT